MSVGVAQFIADVLSVYIAMGLLFAMAFLIFGIGKIDSRAEKTSLGFRFIVLAGVMALWPLLLHRWYSSVTLQ